MSSIIIYMYYDSDLQTCLEYNPQDFVFEDIKDVLAVIEGANDEANWHWILELKKEFEGGTFAYLEGGCDYTGWDCRSSASSFFAKNPFDLLGQSEESAELRRQLETQKDVTWREANDKGVPPIKSLPTSDEPLPMPEFPRIDLENYTL